jgi:hypothetical protein
MQYKIMWCHYLLWKEGKGRGIVFRLNYRHVQYIPVLALKVMCSSIKGTPSPIRYAWKWYWIGQRSKMWHWTLNFLNSLFNYWSTFEFIMQPMLNASVSIFFFYGRKPVLTLAVFKFSLQLSNGRGSSYWLLYMCRKTAHTADFSCCFGIR